MNLIFLFVLSKSIFNGYGKNHVIGRAIKLYGGIFKRSCSEFEGNRAKDRGKTGAQKHSMGRKIVRELPRLRGVGMV